MKFFARSSFVVVFLFVFSISLLILGSFQAFFGTIRWYNSSEQKHENLQKYPIYSATDESPKGDTIRVTIGKKPVISRDVFVVVPNAPQSSEIVSTVNPEKTLETTLKREDYQTSNFTEIVHIKPFKSPIQILLEPSESAMPPGYLATIDSVLAGTYFREILWQFPLTVDTNRLSPRGQMSNESVILSGRIKSTPEMAKVLVHELGHMVDIYLLKQRVKSGDASLEYYAISWSEPTVMRSGISLKSFVSGYSATNQYEDFAEAFTFYVFHNTAFAERAQNNQLLQQKYDFMRDRVFGKYFKNTNYEQNPIPVSLWDVTKIAIKSNALTDIFVALRQIMGSLT